MEREPTEMELLVAKAIADDLGTPWEPGKKFMGLEIEPPHLGTARAAIRAMREPTPQMYVGYAADSGCNVLAIWQDMIDAAAP